MANTIDITLYLVGADEDEAMEGLPFDSQESAEVYAGMEAGIDWRNELQIYTVQATIDFDTMAVVR